MEGEKGSELDQSILEARETASGLEQLIADNASYVQSRVLRFAPNAGSHEREDLFSIAQMAFYEAVNSYSHEKGHFYPFADIVLRRRLIDEIRKTSKVDPELAILDETLEDMDESLPIQSASIKQYEHEKEKSALEMEVEQFNAELAAMGITMSTLEKHSPKHAALKKTYREILRKIHNDPEVRRAIFVKRYYPVKKISELTQISPKKLERSRIYIIAAMIVICGDYIRLAEYIPLGEDI